jgi:glucose 1-dehydrogenase
LTGAAPFRLDGRVVVITGASRGVGAAVARTVAEAGGGCVLVARSADALSRLADELPGPTAVVAGDITDPHVVEEVVAAGDLLGRLWGLVNNAATSRRSYLPLIDAPLQEWNPIFALNVFAAVAFASAVGRRLAALGGGRIVNVSSIGSLTGIPHSAPYSASKAALDSLTRTLAVELGPAGVLCNSLVLGAIATEMLSQALAAEPGREERIIARAPLGRIGTPAEAAWPVLFLLSDAASYVTGQMLVVDGGRLAAG